MKYFKLIRRNLFRNKLRTVLTLGLMFFIFILVSTLLAIQYNFDQYSDAGEGTNRLATQSAVSLATPLPYAMEQKIRQIPGVADVCKVQWIGAYYKYPRDFFANFAIDHDHMAAVFEDYRVDPKEFAAFQKDRQGALVGTELMKRFKWKIGQRITLKRKIFPYDAELVIRGVYHHPVNTSAVYYHMDYHNHMVGDYSMTGNFWVKVKDPKQMSSVSQQIDALYDLAMQEKDFAAVVEMQWFVTEQVEEEKSARDIIAKLEFAGNDARALLEIDRELGARAGLSGGGPRGGGPPGR